MTAPPTRPLTRRDALAALGAGIGSAALTGAPDASRSASAADGPLAPRPPHHPPRAQRVIFLFMEGGPSQADLFDHKPVLNARSGEAIPPSAVPKKIREGKGEDPEQFGALKGSLAKFRRRGASGLWVSDLLPGIAGLADELCVLNGVHADSTEHGAAVQQMHTGMPVLPPPSLGAWLMHGLGSENPNLPGFVVVSPAGRQRGELRHGFPAGGVPIDDPAERGPGGRGEDPLPARRPPAARRAAVAARFPAGDESPTRRRRGRSRRGWTA